MQAGRPGSQPIKVQVVSRVRDCQQRLKKKKKKQSSTHTHMCTRTVHAQPSTQSDMSLRLIFLFICNDSGAAGGVEESQGYQHLV